MLWPFHSNCRLFAHQFLGTLVLPYHDALDFFRSYVEVLSLLPFQLHLFDTTLCAAVAIQSCPLTVHVLASVSPSLSVLSVQLTSVFCGKMLQDVLQ